MKRLPLFPWYDTRKIFYYVIWILILLYIIGTGVYIGVFIQNNASVFTYFKNPGNPGAQLTSLRYKFVDICVRLSIFGHVFFTVFVCCMILYRKNYGCNIFWTILIGICFLLVFLGVIALSNDYYNCNGQNQFGNLCNSKEWCCVNDIYHNINNGCPYVIPCVPPGLLYDL